MSWWNPWKKEKYEKISSLNTVTQKKWRNFKWLSSDIFHESYNDYPEDKWGSAMLVLNASSKKHIYPYNKESEYWNEVAFNKAEISKEFMKIARNMSCYKGMKDSDIECDDNFKDILNMMSFLQDIGAYRGAMTILDRSIDNRDNLVKGYLDSDKETKYRIVSEFLQNERRIMKDIYKIDNLDEEVKKALDVEDKVSAVKDLVTRFCRVVREAEERQYKDLKDTAVKYVKNFRAENRDIFELAKCIPQDYKTEKEENMERYFDFLINGMKG